MVIKNAEIMANRIEALRSNLSSANSGKFVRACVRVCVHAHSLKSMHVYMCLFVPCKQVGRRANGGVWQPCIFGNWIFLE